MGTETKKVKQLTLAELNKKHKELEKQTTHTIQVSGEDFTLKIDNHFTKTKQGELLNDLTEFLNEGNNRFELLDFVFPYTTLLFVKHFTSIDIPSDIDESIKYLSVLTDLDILGDVLSLMPEQEVLNTYNMLEVAINTITENFIEAEKQSEELSEVLKTDFLKQKLKENRFE